MVRITVDPDKCQGYAQCCYESPAIFDLDEPPVRPAVARGAHFEDLYRLHPLLAVIAARVLGAALDVRVVMIEPPVLAQMVTRSLEQGGDVGERPLLRGSPGPDRTAWRDQDEQRRDRRDRRDQCSRRTRRARR